MKSNDIGPTVGYRQVTEVNNVTGVELMISDSALSPSTFTTPEEWPCEITVRRQTPTSQQTPTPPGNHGLTVPRTVINTFPLFKSISGVLL